jgi:hypothetical protein
MRIFKTRSRRENSGLVEPVFWPYFFDAELFFPRSSALSQHRQEQFFVHPAQATKRIIGHAILRQYRVKFSQHVTVCGQRAILLPTKQIVSPDEMLFQVRAPWPINFTEKCSWKFPSHSRNPIPNALLRPEQDPARFF